MAHGLPATVSREAVASAGPTAATRTECSFCRRHVDVSTAESQSIPSNVRAHRHQSFNIWRCPDCRTLHCLEVVDLPTYYRSYPLPGNYGTLERYIYGQLHSRLTRRGFKPGHRFLDYGCGRGFFLRFLQESGYRECYGYDLYSEREEFHDASALAVPDGERWYLMA